MFEDEPDVVECTRCGEEMKQFTPDIEGDTLIVGYRCENCHAKEVDYIQDPIALAIKQHEELWKEYQMRKLG